MKQTQETRHTQQQKTRAINKILKLVVKIKMNSKKGQRKNNENIEKFQNLPKASSCSNLTFKSPLVLSPR
jgi:hypothetical protein